MFKANLSGAKLWGAAPALVNLTNANLTDAALIRVDLTGARLEGAKLEGADPRVNFQKDVMGRETRDGLARL